jgi:hypothetical protein
MVRRTGARFLVALLVTLFVGGIVLTVSRLQSMGQQPVGQRPSLAASSSYSLSMRVGEHGPFKDVGVAADGGGCEVLSASDYLYRACVLTTNLDPVVIAGAAFGRINEAPTPAFEALIWRGVLSDDASICAGGGLKPPLLTECLSAVASRGRVASDGGATVRVSSP